MEKFKIGQVVKNESGLYVVESTRHGLGGYLTLTPIRVDETREQIDMTEKVQEQLSFVFVRR